MVKDLHGDAHLLQSIEQCERNLREKYEQMLKVTPESEAAGVLHRQRNEVEFGEQVLHSMQEPIGDNKPMTGATGCA